MARALIIIAPGFTDSEFTYALDRCREEDILTHVATLDGKNAIGEKGWTAKANLSTADAYDIASGSMYDILILPGGVKSIEKVRQDAATLEIIKLHYAHGKIIATMCHGSQLLIETGLVKGRKVSGYYSIKTDIINAGGEYIAGVAQDGNIISAPHYDLNGKWMKAVIQAWQWQEKLHQTP